MSYQPARTLFGLIAVGGAVAVGVTTHDAGFTALTFVGGLLLPRILGLRSHRGWGPGAHHRHGHRHDEMRKHFAQRAEEWHRQAHGEQPAQPVPASTAGA